MVEFGRDRFSFIMTYISIHPDERNICPAPTPNPGCPAIDLGIFQNDRAPISHWKWVPGLCGSFSTFT